MGWFDGILGFPVALVQCDCCFFGFDFYSLSHTSIIDYLNGFHIRTTQYSLIRDHIAEVLVEIGGIEVNKRLLQMLPDKQIGDSVRLSVASALSKAREQSLAFELVHVGLKPSVV
jgi:hypothetical protein